MKKTVLFFVVLFYSLTVRTQTVTWNKDIAPIMFKHCTSCHHIGGNGPMPLTNYQTTYNYRYLIKWYIDSLIMPPWPPDPTYADNLAHARVLSPQEKNAIHQWISDGAPKGTEPDPVVPVYTNDYQIPNADLNIRMAPYVVNTTSSNKDLYRCFVIKTNLNQEEFANQIEIIPGNKKIVHHVLVFEEPDSVGIAKMDTLFGDPQDDSYTSFFAIGYQPLNILQFPRLVGEWVPGTEPLIFPPGMGVKLRKFTRLIIQIHYPKGVDNEVDSTRIRIKYTTEATPREVILAPFLSEEHIINGPIKIPPGEVKTYHSQNVVSAPVSLIAVGPHMHLLGKRIKGYFLDHFGDTIPMIRINKWDFRWQGAYFFKKLIRVPIAYTARAEATFDNRMIPSNPYAVNDTVRQGENTTDEMMQMFIAFTFYKNGDENIYNVGADVGIDEIQNDIVKTLQFYEVYPNPSSSDAITINCFSPTREKVFVKIYNTEGKEVSRLEKELEAGFNNFEYDTKNLAAGTYIIKIKSSNALREKKFIKTN